MTLNKFIFSPFSYDALQACDSALVALATVALKISRIPFEVDPASNGFTIKVTIRKPFNEKDYHSIALAFAEAALLLGLRIRWNGCEEEHTDVTVFEILDPEQVTNWNE